MTLETKCESTCTELCFGGGRQGEMRDRFNERKKEETSPWNPSCNLCGSVGIGDFAKCFQLPRYDALEM